MRLKQLRTVRRLTQASLARKANVTREYVNLLEAGHYDPTVSVARRLAKALGVSVPVLVQSLPRQRGGPRKRLVFYAVGQYTPDGDWDPNGDLHRSKREALQELREWKPVYPSTCMVRIVVTPCGERRSQKTRRAR